MMTITIISSMSVKPLLRRTRAPKKIFCIDLPVLVLRTVEPSSIARGVNLEHVLTAPRGRVRAVLVRALAPLAALGHRVDGNATQELQLSTGCIVGHRHALDEHVEIFRVAFVRRVELSCWNEPLI